MVIHAHDSIDDSQPDDPIKLRSSKPAATGVIFGYVTTVSFRVKKPPNLGTGTAGCHARPVTSEGIEFFNDFCSFRNSFLVSGAQPRRGAKLVKKEKEKSWQKRQQLFGKRGGKAKSARRSNKVEDGRKETKLTALAQNRNRSTFLPGRLFCL